jgi:hypothetical protein
MDYTLDAKEARKADSTGDQIKEIGKYIGEFTQVIETIAKKGTNGVIFSFKSDSGEKATLPIYTVKADGEKIMGFQILMAIMTCLQLRALKSVNGTAKKYDYELKQEVDFNAVRYPELEGKKIGLLLETEEYEKQDKEGNKTGEIGTKVVLAGVFQANTELTASEILDKKTEPKQLAKMVERLRHRALKPQAARPASAPQRPMSPDDSGLDEEIPF